MNKLFIIALMLLTVGCTAVPVKQGFPSAPAELLQPAAKLTPLASDKRELSDLIDNATDNYAKYYELVVRYEAWQLWYQKQKNISKELNTK